MKAYFIPSVAYNNMEVALGFNIYLLVKPISFIQRLQILIHVEHSTGRMSVTLVCIYSSFVRAEQNPYKYVLVQLMISKKLIWLGQLRCIGFFFFF